MVNVVSPSESSLPVGRDRAALDVKGSDATHEVRYLIIGAGLAGLGMALRLKTSGRRDFLVLEKDSEPGGYWRRCSWPDSLGDTPSQLNAFSFAPCRDWPRKYPFRDDMLDYIRQLVSRHGLEPCIQFGAEVISLRYLDELQRWQVELQNGQYFRAEFVMLGMGALSGPDLPPVSGMDDFRGAVFHASEWDYGLDMTGRHVAVVGTGESAIQAVPAVTARAAAVTLFQEEPAWVMPRQNRVITAVEKTLLAGAPWLYRRQRQRLLQRHDAQFSVTLPGSRSHQQAGKRAINHLKHHVSNLQKRRQLTPDYPIGSRPIRYSDEYYRAVNQEHVRVVDSPVREVTWHHVIGEDGSRCAADTLIFGTPWRWPDGLVPTGMIIGPFGSDLGRSWQTNGISSYRGLCVPGMPNLFLLNGPHTKLRDDSPVLMLEAQYGAIIDCLSHMEQQGLVRFEVRPEAAEDFSRHMQKAVAGRVWGTPRQGHLSSRGHGSESMPLWPHDMQTYRSMMQDFDRDAFLWC